MNSVQIKSILLQTLADILEITVSSITPESNFLEYGLDSSKSIEFVARLNEQLHIDLGVEAVFDYTTVKTLQRHIVQNFLRSNRMHTDKAERESQQNKPSRTNTQQILVRVLSQLLEIPASTINPESSFLELGLDSTQSIDYIIQLNEQLGIELEVEAVFDYPTLQSFTDYVHQLSFLHITHTEENSDSHATARQREPEVNTAVSAGDMIQPHADTDIAVIGMSGRFPGADDVETFWENLCSEKCTVSEFHRKKLLQEVFYGPEIATNSPSVNRGGFLGTIDAFDSSFFKISPMEAEKMDPQQRIFLEEAYRAIESAGYNPRGLEQKDIGVFVGVRQSGYLSMIGESRQALDAQALLGNDNSILASRISYFLNFKGPAMAIDTACSSSLAAVHVACQSVARGESEMALAGGIFIMTNLDFSVMASRVGMVSSQGNCRPFDDRADGIVCGEACGIVVLKTLASALRDRDHIYGVIKATALNQDGRTKGITAPSTRSQISLLQKTCKLAGIPPEKISYIEAHGTGSKLGDQIELKALKTVYGNGDYPCYIGSHRGNIGHSMNAAGMCGLIKVLLSLEHNRIPPTLGYEKLNEYATFQHTRFIINSVLQPWQSIDNYPLTAAVSSFGYAGINSHLIVQQCTTSCKTVSTVQKKTSDPVIIPFSARTGEQLHILVQRFADFLDTNPDVNIQSLAYTLQTGREPMEERLGVIASSGEELNRLLNAYMTDNTNHGRLFRGKAAVNSETASLFTQETALQEAVETWIQHGAYSKLLELWVKGFSLDWNRLYKGNTPVRISLPAYPFARSRHWIPPSSAAVHDAPIVSQEIPPVLSEVINSLSPQDSREQISKLGNGFSDPSMESLMREILFSTLCSLGLFKNAKRSLKDCNGENPPLTHHQNWLDESVAYLTRMGYLKSDATLDREPESLVKLWNQWDKEKQLWLADPSLEAQVNVADRVMRVIPDILTGKQLITEILFPDSSMELVKGIYQGNRVADYFNRVMGKVLVACIQMRREKNCSGKIRILEIGAGTGGTTIGILPRLKTFGDAIEEYCFTDVSRAFLIWAEDRFKKEFPFLEPQIFDVSKPLTDQAVRENWYDFVIATNVLHATPDMRTTLRNTKAILKPNGILLLNELSTWSLFFHATFAFLEGWWLGQDRDLRIPGSPALYPQTWKALLQEEGFAPVCFPAKKAHFSGQQVIAAAKDGVTCRHNGQPAVQMSATRTAAVPEKGNHAIYTAEEQQSISTVAPNWHGSMYEMAPGSIKNTLREDTQPGAYNTMTHAAESKHDSAVYGDWGAVTDQMRKDYVDQIIAENLSHALKLELHAVDYDKPLADYGVDSITGVTLVKKINQALNIKLQTKYLFDFSSVNALSEFIRSSWKQVITAQLRQTASVNSVPQSPNSATDPVISGVSGHQHPVVSISREENRSFEPIAVVGMSGRFAQSEDLDEFWDHLKRGDDLVGDVTRWSAPQCRPCDSPNQQYCSKGSFIDSIARFDPLFFKIAPQEAIYMDPQQRLFLEESWKALENAGYAGKNMQGMSCGVYVGFSASDYADLFSDHPPAQAYWGTMGSLVPARIAYYLNLHGPAISVDTACSSSLVAVHLACQGLWTRETNMALAGGVFLQSTPRFFQTCNRAQMLSPRGRCHTFDSRADGFVPGEGVGVIVLKRLDDAQRDRDFIHAVIVGSGLNQDGSSNGITAPSAQSQQRLEQDVYDRFHIHPESIHVVEAHGTGTALGDPIEFEGLVQAFRKYTSKSGYCALGSVKTSIGHTAAAAGIAGILKLLLSLKHRQIPPVLHFQQCNPEIALDASPFFINTELQNWEPEPGNVRRAAVSSFGISGTNAHMVIEQAPDLPIPAVQTPGYLIVLSARSHEQLRQQVRNMIRFCKQCTEHSLNDVTFTLFTGRMHWNHRLSCVVRNREELIRLFEKWLETETLPQIYCSEIHQRQIREQPSLKNYGNQCIRECRKTADSVRYLEHLATIADLYIQGYTLEFEQLFPETSRRIPLPTYPFAAKEYWVDHSEAPKKMQRFDTDVSDAQTRPGDDSMSPYRTTVRNDHTEKKVLSDNLSVPGVSAGLITLCPVWHSVSMHALPVPDEPEGNVIVAGAAGSEIEMIRYRYPDCKKLEMDTEATVDSIRKQIEACGPVNHFIWIAESKTSGSPVYRGIIDAQEQGVMQLFMCIKALLHMGYGTRELVMTAITVQTQPVCTNDTVHPAHASVHGLIGSVAKEYPHWKIRLLDMDSTGQWPVTEMFQLPFNSQGNALAYRHKEWFVREMVPVEPFSGQFTGVYKTEGVYVVIGGAGGIGEVWSRWMIEKYQARVIWIGRRAFDAAIQKKIDALSLPGPAPVYIQADATDRASLEKALAHIKQHHYRINGIVHSAIVLKDAGVATMDEQRFKTCLEAKVNTSVYLAEVFENENPDFVLFFSSMNTFAKTAGQSNYAAGCTFIDAFAQRLSQDWTCLVKVMNWGYWGSVGIVTDSFYKKRMEKNGIGSIEAAEGMEAVERLITGPLHQLGFVKTIKPQAMDSMGGMSYRERITVYPQRTPVSVSLHQISCSSSIDAATALDQIQSIHNSCDAEMEKCLCTLLAGYLSPFVESGERIDCRYERWMEESLSILTKEGMLGKHAGNRHVPAHGVYIDVNAAWNQWDRQKAVWSRDPFKKVQITLAQACVRALPAILTGKKLATEVIFPDSSLDLVEGIYKNNPVSDLFNSVLYETLCAYIREVLDRDDTYRIRILEIGAGTGGTTAGLLPRLLCFTDRIEEYCYTDLSDVFLMHARQHYLPLAPYLKTRIVNAEKPLTIQGIAADGYDVVIAANVLHATQNIRHTLRNVKTALHKNGILLLNELSRNSLFYHVTFGLLHGWWRYEDPHVRIPGCPGIYPKVWKRLLQEEGFDPVLFAQPTTHRLGQQIIAAQSNGVARETVTADQKTPTETEKNTPTVLCQEKKNTATVMHQNEEAGEVTDQMICDFVKESVLDTISGSLRIDSSEIDREDPFSEYGVDSILAVRLTNDINRFFAIGLETVDLFDHNSVDKLTSYIAETYRTQLIQGFFADTDHNMRAVSLSRMTTDTGCRENEHTADIAVSDQQCSETDRHLGTQRLDSRSTPAAVCTGMDQPHLTAPNQHAGISVGKPGPIVSPRLPSKTDTFYKKKEHADMQMHAAPEPIAVIGMSGRFAQAETVEAFWHHLANGDDLVREVTRWDFSRYESERTTGRNGFCRHGGYLDRIDQFDALFFKISPMEATYMDPQQRFFLEESWKALEDAGYVGEYTEKARCGVFMGCGSGHYASLFSGPVPPQSFWGNANPVIPARIAYYLNLRGPAIAIDTACSSSLVAIHLACQSLWCNETEMALAGGVFIQSTPEIHVASNDAGMLSSTGRCHTFDESADGFVYGEGVGIVVLKRLCEAMADGDHIYGVIRGSGINQDGATNGITAPSALSQEQLEKEVYERFAVDPESIQMVEAHGTGTKLGDPIEFRALHQAFRSYTKKTGFCALGSVKTNIGHLGLAAGVAGVIKILLSLKYKKIPASLHFHHGNAKIPFEGSPFFVNTSLCDWLPENGAKRRAAISSFGFSGTNAHMVIEQAPQSRRIHAQQPGYLVVLSAQSAAQRSDQVKNLLHFCKNNPEFDLGNLSFTLLLGRKHWNHRFACVVRNSKELVTVLHDWLEKGRSAQVYVSSFDEGHVRQQPSLVRYGNQCIENCQNPQQTVRYLEDLAAIADLYIQGYTLCFKNLYRHGYSRISLPTYPFLRESYWVEPRKDQVVQSSTTVSGPFGSTMFLHPLLHENISDFYAQRFRTRFTGNEFFLEDHRVRGQKVLPGVVYLEMARTAVEHATGNSARGILMKNIVWAQPVVVDTPQSVTISLIPPENETISFEIYSSLHTDQAEKTIVHSQGIAQTMPLDSLPSLDLETVRKKFLQSGVGPDECYRAFQTMGIDYGPAHRGIETLYIKENEVLAKLALPASVTTTKDQFILHPTLLDSALQASIGLAFGDGALNRFADLNHVRPLMPFALDSCEIYGRCCHSMWALVRLADSPSPNTVTPARKFDMDLCDDHGTVCVRIRGLSSRVLERDRTEKNGHIATLLLKPVWTEQPLPQNAPDAKHTGIPFSNHFVFIAGFTSDMQMLKEKAPQSIFTGFESGDIPGSNGNLQQRFTACCVKLLEYVKKILTQKLPGKTLIQILVPQEGPKQVFAALSGLLKTAHGENPDLWGQVIAVASDSSVDYLLTVLNDNVQCPHDQHIRYQHGKRFVQKFEEIPASESELQIPWKHNGVYLITGGAGGLGMIFAGEIVKQVTKATLILAGRTELDVKRLKQLDALRRQGATVEYTVMNAADVGAVETVINDIKNRFGRLHGIIHSAGVIQDSFIIQKTGQQTESVLAPKVSGTVHLDRATKGMDLDFFVLFSAGAAVVGNVGQADYAAANAFMDHFAHFRHALRAAGQRCGQTLAVNWPLWKEGGMRLDHTIEQQLQQRLGMVAMETSSGMKAFYQSLACREPQIVVMEGERHKLYPFFCSRKSVDLFHWEEVTEMETAIEDDHLEHNVVEYFKEQLAAVLKLPPHRIAAADPLEKFGIDSLMALQLTNELEKTFGSLPKTLFFEVQSIQELSNHFMKLYRPKLVQLLSSQEKRPVLPEKKYSLHPQQQQSYAAAPKRPFSNTAKPNVSFRTLPNQRTGAALDIAVIGLSGRYPQARDLPAFWRNLCEARNCITEIPEDRWDWRMYYGENADNPVSHRSKWGGFIADVDTFDADFFNITAQEAMSMDPQERLFLEYSWHALEDAGYTRDDLQKIVSDDGLPGQVGVYAGVMYGDYQLYGIEENLRGNPVVLSSSFASIANRVSYILNLHGPSMTVDTMCSSSLTSIHLACQDLKQGRTGLAVAGGVNITIHPNKYLALSKGKYLSSQNRCESFGEGGDGYIPGEGIGVAILKRLSEAQRDGDHIYGIIKASAMNHGGKTNGYTVPNPHAQKEVILHALHEAGIAPNAISYIEGHGTGTKLGDSIELSALTKAFGSEQKKQCCWIGSVKSNIGHCESAAGMAAITKVLLQMKHAQLVPSINADVSNPYFDFQNSPFAVNRELRDWSTPIIEGKPYPRIAGISSFGAGGANAHLIIEEYIPHRTPTASVSDTAAPVIVVLSARNRERLHHYAENLLHFIRENKTTAAADIWLADLGYTLQTGREAMDERLGMIVRSIEDLESTLQNVIAGRTRNDTLCAGRVKPEQETDTLFTEDEDFCHIMDSWITKGKYDKLLKCWVKGMKVDWSRLYTENKPQRISAPVYPFAAERFWFKERSLSQKDAGPSEAALGLSFPLRQTCVQAPRKEQTCQGWRFSLPGNGCQLKNADIANFSTDEKAQLFLRQLIADHLQKPITAIQAAQGCIELGLNSIGLVSITSQIQDKIDSPFLPSLFFEYKTISELSAYLAAHHKPAIDRLIVTKKEVENDSVPADPIVNSNSEVQQKTESRETRRAEPTSSEYVLAMFDKLENGMISLDDFLTNLENDAMLIN